MTAHSLLRCPVNPPIGEALSSDALGGGDCALYIVESSLFPFAIDLDALLAVVVAEIKFGRITLEMLFADMVERADDPALEDGEITLDRVGVRVPANIFSRLMVHGVMVLEHRGEDAELAFAIRHKVRLLGIQLRVQDRAQGLGVDGVNVEGADPATSLDQREHTLFVNPADGLAVALGAVAVLFLPSNVGRVSLDRAAASREHTVGAFHGLADAMRHEPSGLVGHAKGALKLLAADAFLAGTHKVHGLQPDMQLNLAALKHGANRYRELLAAVLALVKAGAVRLAFKLVMVLGLGPAVRADRATGPTDSFQPLAGLGHGRAITR